MDPPSGDKRGVGLGSPSENDLACGFFSIEI